MYPPCCLHSSIVGSVLAGGPGVKDPLHCHQARVAGLGSPAHQPQPPGQRPPGLVVNPMMMMMMMMMMIMMMMIMFPSPDHGVDGVQVPGLRVLDNLGEEGATHPLPRSRGCSAVISVPSYLLCLLRLPSKRMNSSLLSVSSQHTAPAWYAGARYHV